MPRLRLDRVSLTLPGRISPFSLAGLLPAFCLSASVPVLNNVALELADGERLALLGKHGSGKTSLLRLLAGRLSPCAGTCSITGSLVSIVDVESCLDVEATGQENLERLVGDRADEAAELVGMANLLDVPVRHCSPGMRYRLGFATLAVCPGEVLLIDECVQKADLSFRPMMVSRLNQLIARSKVAVIAEPMLMARCNRFEELIGGQLRSLETTGWAVA